MIYCLEKIVLTAVREDAGLKDSRFPEGALIRMRTLQRPYADQGKCVP